MAEVFALKGFPVMPLLTFEDKVAPVHTAVLVIDVQNDFCSDQGYAGVTGSDLAQIKTMLPRLRNFVERCRLKGVTVIFVQLIQEETTFSEPMRELRHRKGWKKIACEKGTWGADFYPDIRPAPGEKVVEKRRYSSFSETNLEAVLRELGVRTLVLTGVATNLCVETTARDGFLRGYYIVCARDCMATNHGSNIHEGALVNLDGFFGQVVSSEHLLEAWKGVREATVEKT